MLKMTSFRCFLIGEDILLIQCAEILRENNHSILGIISEMPKIKEWAEINAIPHFKSIKAANNFLKDIPFDYLFSIVNPYYISSELLALPIQFAINFHNSLLPKYGGVHATSWSILNTEKKHGITWHVMSDTIDAGDILKQKTIKIEEKETALSLSVKCYQQAIRSFTELIHELQNQTYVRITQDPSLRTYYKLHQKPYGNGWIDWSEPAENIDKLCRALHLGHYANYFSSPKFLLGEYLFIVNSLQILDYVSNKPPGTVCKVFDGKWQISTATKDVLLSQVVGINNEYSQLDQPAVKDCLITQKKRLISPSKQQLIMFTEHSQAYNKFERFWVKQLLELKPTPTPFLPLLSTTSNTKKLKLFQSITIQKPLLKKLKAKLPSEIDYSLILFTAWLIYLYKLTNESHITLTISHSELQNIPKALTKFFSCSVPFTVSFEPHLTFIEAVKIVSENYQYIKSRGTFLNDCLYRYPELNNITVNYPLAVLITEQHLETLDLENINAELLVTINNEKLHLFVNEKLLQTETCLSEILDKIPGHLLTLLKSASLDKEHSLIDLNLLTQKEYKQVLVEWNKTDTKYPIDKTIIQIFEEQVKKFPQNIAISCEGDYLTYDELNKKANLLAVYLQKNGAINGEFIVVCSAQSIELIVGVLAILKLGCAYIPVDANYPAQHIKFILEDARPCLILTKEIYKKSLEACLSSTNLDTKIINFEDDWSICTDTFLEVPNLSPLNSAYIIYTSGTTGHPKGVIVTHRGVIRLVKNTNYININPFDCIAQAASPGFDAATFEIWGALLNGAKLVCISKSILLDISRFSHLLEEEQITILWLTSALFNDYVSIQASIFKNLTYLLVGGDVVSPEKIGLLFNCHEGMPRHIINGYGPTENTTFSTTYEIIKPDSNKTSIPIGRPIANSTTYILNNYLQPVPVGVAGELYVGGDGLALGYLNRDALTVNKFILNPFSKDYKNKLYKTGDRARWLPDGNLDYLGRQDNQVKIRGYRVELEAVQSYLLQHPMVSQAYLTTYENSKHVKFLIAYIIPMADLRINVSEIRDFMCNKLPTYMVPSYFVLLEKLPLTANGKINSNALPPPDLNQRFLLTEHIAPRTIFEHQLKNIWCKLLDCKVIGIYDNFFDLGGHSLLLAKLILELEDKFDFPLSLYEFLENPTIEYLAKLITENNTDKVISESPNIYQIDSNLSLEIKPIGEDRTYVKLKTILLTGATGFLGAHLLNDLYRMTNTKIYCLVKAKTISDGKRRLNDALARYCLSTTIDNRIIPIIGDLSEPYLGLTPEYFSQLANEIDVIYHNGAQVHHLYNYDTLRAANVLGTIEILKLATTSKNKQLFYVSTLSAVSNYTDNNGVILEDFIPSSMKSCKVLDGYSQTKWVAEKLLAQAQHRGVFIKIYRPGWILGQSQLGIVSAETNHLLLLIKGCIQLGYAPMWNARLNILPVDFVSQFIVKSSLSKNIDSKVFNLINPYKLNWIDLIENIISYGYQVNLIPVDEWNKWLKKIDHKNPLFGLLPLYRNSGDKSWVKSLDRIYDAHYESTENTVKHCKLTYPKINKDLLDRYLDYLQEQGFLNPLNNEQQISTV